MAERKWTDLERKIRWFFKNCGEYINSETLDLILISKWDNPREKLVFEEGSVENKYQDILALAKKLGNLESK